MASRARAFLRASTQTTVSVPTDDSGAVGSYVDGMSRRSNILLVALALLPACASGSDTSAPSTSPSTSTVPPVAAEVIETRVAFLVALMNDPTGTDDPTLGEHFTPDFLAHVPPAAIRKAVIDATAAGTRPWTIARRNIEQSAGQLVIESADAQRLVIVFELEPGSPRRIAGATIQPSLEDLFTKPGTVSEADAALRAVSPRVSYAVLDADCAVVRELDGSRALPLGSAFKLWVLDALTRAIEAGTATWDETITIQARYRSSPDGEVYPLADGASVTLRRLAELMISISDNTATDHLIGRLGRSAVERVLRDLDISTVDANTPFLTTRELFSLKFINPTLAGRYIALTTSDARRSFLDTVVAGTPLTWPTDPGAGGAADLTRPRHIDTIEWFATPLDLCRTLVDLDRLAKRPGLAPVAEILSINPGFPFPPQVWAEVRYKGGSEPGVFTTAHWLRAAHGMTRVVVVSLSDPEQPLDEGEAASAVSRLLALAPSLPAA